MDGSGAEARALLFAGFRLDPETRSLTRDGVPAPLTPMVFSTLLHLIRRAGAVVTKDELAQAVWSGRAVGDSTITQTVYTLRQALEAAGSQAHLISTVSGRGYRFVGEVRTEAQPVAACEILDPARLDLRPDVGPANPPQAPPRPRRPGVLAVTAGLAALAASAIAVVGLNPWRHPAPPGPPTVIVQAAFQNLTPDHGFDRSLGRVVEVDLGQSPRVRVLTERQVSDTLTQMARPSDQTLDVRLAGQVCLRDNGQAVVEGALAPVGGRYLVTLTATACGDGRLLSAQKRLVDRREDVVPALDAMIDRTRRDLGESADTVRRFDTPLLPGQTGSLAALEAYSRGVRASDQGRLGDAIALQQHAIDLDPRFAAAHLELARALFNIGRSAESRAEITKAFALRDSANEELRYSIEILYHLIVDLDYRRALALARAATDTFPDHLIGWGQQANLDIQFGRYDEAGGPPGGGAGPRARGRLLPARRRPDVGRTAGRGHRGLSARGGTPRRGRIDRRRTGRDRPGARRSGGARGDRDAGAGSAVGSRPRGRGGGKRLRGWRDPPR
jgi:DNA-binding winged helix-turn-helix (wHTH) protein